MSELWQMKGREPVLWTIPLYVSWTPGSLPRSGIALSAIPLLHGPKIALENALRSFAVFNGEGWQLEKQHLEKTAVQFPIQDPERLFSWERPRMSQRPEFWPELRVERDEFLDALWQKGVGESRSQLERMWYHFCDHIADWLINQDKPVDMYLFKLHNSPYRVDWMDKLNHRFPKMGPMFREMDGGEHQTFLFRGDTWEDFCSLDLIAMGSQGTLHRSITIEHKPEWWKMMRKVEWERRMVLGSVEYAKSIVGSIKKRVAVSVRLFVEWYKARHRPSGIDVAGGFHGDYRMLADFRAPRMVRGRRRIKAPLSIDVVPNPAAMPPTKSRPLAIPEANGSLPAVPPLQPEAADVRNGGPDPAHTGGDS